MRLILLTSACCISLLTGIAQARTVSWDLSGVDESTTWSEYRGQKVAIAISLNGAEVGRCWDNPALRECDIPMTLPKYYRLAGKLFFYPAPFPSTPGEGIAATGQVGVTKKEAIKRVLDDGVSMAEMPKNSIKGKGTVSFGPAR